jgi:hypothetical protein
MTNCRHCGNYLLPGSRFCDSCGAKTQAAEFETQAAESTVAEIECFLSVFGGVPTNGPDTARTTMEDIECFLSVFGCENNPG